MVDASSYYRRWMERSWQETMSVWTSYRWWLSASPPVASVLLLLARQGWRSIMNISDVLVNATGGAAIAFLGSLFISLIRSPKLLDQERQVECENAVQEKQLYLNDFSQQKTREITELTRSHTVEVARWSIGITEAKNELAKCREELALKHPADAAQEQMVKAAIAKLDRPETDFVKWLLTMGSADNVDISKAGYHDTVLNRVVDKIAPVNLIKRISYRPGNGLIEMGFTCEINPELKTALRNILFR
jgi:hypothetical protein